MKPHENNTKEKRDLFNYKWIARFYRNKSYPLTFQILLVLALSIFIYDGFIGSENSDENLITLSLSGVFWYPLIFASLYFFGRSWCAVCPVGAIAGAFNRFSIERKFPRRLCNWGLPLLTFVIPLWGFREFGINVLREPLITAIWIVSVIAIAIIVSLIFKGRVFCKYICPITAPLAVMSRVAPIEVRTKTMATHSSMTNKHEYKEENLPSLSKSSSMIIKEIPLLSKENNNRQSRSIVGVGKIDPTCKTCKTHDCYNGNEHVEGCPWEEHPATMTSNAACSMCMKCVHSCPPAEPMRLRLRMPFAELWQVFRPNIYEAFTILALIGIFNTYLWHESMDLILPRI